MLESVTAQANVPPVNPSKSTSSANIGAVSLILLSVALGAIGQLALKAAVNGMGQLDLSLQTLLNLVTNPLLILALAIYGISAVFWLLALRRAELSFVYPFLSLTFIAVLFGGALLFRERISALRLAGFGVVILGLFIVARGEQMLARKSRTGE